MTGTCATQMRKYPWGNGGPAGCNEMNWSGCPVATNTSPVASYPNGASPYGAMDMGGGI